MLPEESSDNDGDQDALFYDPADGDLQETRHELEQKEIEDIMTCVQGLFVSFLSNQQIHRR